MAGYNPQEISSVNRQVYNAFAGCDMIAHINTKPIGILNAVTLSITREVVPIYTTGSANPRTFVKGKRGIAGSIVFGVFDRHAITNDIFKEDFTGARNTRANAIKKWVDQMGNKEYGSPNQVPLEKLLPGDAVLDRGGLLQKHLDYLYETPLKYSDEVPPFNITITFVNGNGAASTMSIYGVQLINETSAYTMDDMSNDLSVTYVARDVDPLINLTSASFTK